MIRVLPLTAVGLLIGLATLALTGSLGVALGAGGGVVVLVGFAASERAAHGEGL